MKVDEPPAVAALLEARAIEVHYGKTAVVRGVTLSVERSKVVALLGPTGAGKTTIFRALVGERTPDGGEVRFAEQNVTRWPLWRRARLGLGYIPQTPSVLPDLKVRANLDTYERIVGGKRHGAEHWAKVVGLTERLGVRAGELSGGERRLLELARALVGRPKVLVCDEPFAGIDPRGAWRVAEMLRERADRGLGVLISDHHAAIALKVSDRALLLLGGELSVQAPPQEFSEHPVVREHYLGSSFGVV